MSNELVVKEQSHVAYIEKNSDLIANQSKLNGDDLRNFLIQCKRTGLDPITRQIYAIPNNGKMTIMASIDGLRLIADRSGVYEGQTAPQWCDENGVWTDVWLKKVPPTACKIGVHKKNFKEPLIAIAIFDEYAGKKNGSLTFMWGKMPALMIAKVAEALALRKAFPNEMSGIYSTEEMDQASQEQSKDVTPEPKKHITEKVADVAANNPKIETTDLSEYVVQFGKKFAGKKLKDIDAGQLESYIFDYLDQESKKKNQPLSGAALELFNNGKEYLRQLNAEIPQLDTEEVMPF